MAKDISKGLEMKSGILARLFMKIMEIRKKGRRKVICCVSVGLECPPSVIKYALTKLF